MANESFKNLDFDSIKTALKSYLSSKSEYADHNFDGSTWNLVLDVLSWTTHYIGVHSNLALSESFLDSADLRNSVVSRAKELGYFPKQKTASTAGLSISVTGADANISGSIIPKGHKFSAAIDGNTYEFEAEANTFLYEIDGAGDIPVDVDGVPTGAVTGTGNYKTFNDVIIKQGFPANQSWVAGTDTRYIISDFLIDTDTLTIEIDGVEWTNGNDQLITDGTTQSYWLQEVEDGKVEVYFGDDVIGAQPTNGVTITANWLTTKGSEANNIRIFSIDSPAPSLTGANVTAYTLTTTSISAGGSEKESTERIKLIAPRVYTTQNRLVTAEDYRALILANFAYAAEVAVWGGENDLPPRFGYVLIAISKAGNGREVLTTQQRADIAEFVDKYKVITQNVEIIDPDYIDIDMDLKINYDQYKTTKSQDDLSTILQSAVEQYFTDNLNTFGSTLRLSKFLSYLDASDAAFVDTNAEFTMKRVITPIAAQFQTLTFNYSGNELVAGSFISDTYDTDKYFKDNGNGIIQLYDGVDVVNGSAGTINYETSQVTINNIYFPTASDITFSAVGVNSNIVAQQNNILAIGNYQFDFNLLTKND